MSNYQYSSNAVDSLIAYINDVKPFHSKLSEVVEEYQFYENLNVDINDAKHFTRVKVSGIWDNEVYANGVFPPFFRLPFAKHFKSSTYWSNDYLIDNQTKDTQIPGLQSGYALRHNVGLRRVQKNGKTLLEGLDFHVTHGAYTATIDGQKQLASTTVLGADSTFDDTSLRYDDYVVYGKHKTSQVIDAQGVVHDVLVKNPLVTVTDIVPNLHAENYEEWELKCVQSVESTSTTNVQYEETFTATTVKNIAHQLDSTDLFIQCYYVDADNVLQPIVPNKIIFLNSNEIQVRFTRLRKYKIRIVKHVDSSVTFNANINTPSNVWEIQHNLGTTNLMTSVRTMVNGELTPINPNSIEFVDLNTIKVKFSNNQLKTGAVSIGSIENYSTKVFEEPVAKNIWSFNNTLGIADGFFSVVDSAGSIVFPKRISINTNNITVEFSKPTSGKLMYASLFTAGKEQSIFSVTGSSSGLIGYARPETPFVSGPISFNIIPNDLTYQFTVGETYVLTPANRITSHKDYTDTDEWSIIKVNPIAYKRPRFSKAGGPSISTFNFLNAGAKDQVLTITFIDGRFEVVSSVLGNMGFATFGNNFVASDTTFYFVLSAGNYAPANGDYFSVRIINEAPKIENLDLTIGYDPDLPDGYASDIPPDGNIESYSLTPYDDIEVGFDLTTLQLAIVDPAIANSFFTITFNGTNFDVIQYTDATCRQELNTFAQAEVGVPYNNGKISFTVPSSISYVNDEVFTFNVTNRPPEVDSGDFVMISDRFGSIHLYPKSFIDSPGQTWTIEFISPTEFSVSADGVSSSMTFANGNVSKSYDNGFIHFTLFQNSQIPFATGDRFFVTIQDEKPSFLIHNKTTGFYDPLTIGKWYWNGKIGLKIALPKIKIREYDSRIADPRQWPFRQIDSLNFANDPAVKFNTRSDTVLFTRPPRFDASGDVYTCSLLTTSSAYKHRGLPQIFNVASARQGTRKAAKVGSTYIEDGYPEQSSPELSSTLPHDGLFEFQISKSGPDFVEYDRFTETHNDSSFTFEIISDEPKLYHADDVIIFEAPLTNEVVTVERETTDKVFVKTSSKRPELGVNPADPSDQWIPTYVVATDPFSDENDAITLYSSTLNEPIAKVQNVTGANESYQFVMKRSFFEDGYLPFNTRIGTRVSQSEQENSILKTRISEFLKFSDKISFYDNLNISLTEGAVGSDLTMTEKFSFSLDFPLYDPNPLPDGQPNPHRFGLHDVVNVSIFDAGFKGFFAGYDTLPYDEDPNNYDDTDTIQTSWFGNVAGGMTPLGGFGGHAFMVNDKPSGDIGTSKINETMTIYSRMTPESIGFADEMIFDGLPVLDSEGWTNATVTSGLSLVDAEGWTNATFDGIYGTGAEIPPDTTYELTVTISKLASPVGSIAADILVGTPYEGFPASVININRKTSIITIIKRGTTATTAIMYTDLQAQTQAPSTVLENTADFLKIEILTPSTGTLVVF